MTSYPEATPGSIYRAGYRALCCLAIAALHSLTVLGATPGAAGGIEETVRLVEGVRLEIRSNPALPVRGTYLIALNYMPNHMELKPPYRSLLLSVDGSGRIELLRAFSSEDLRVFVTDLKPQPDGVYSYALNRARPPNWSYELKLLDPKTGADVTPPKTYPTSDPELDGHETITYVGERRLFLFYRARKEGGAEYTDMEIQAISSKTGKVVGKWSSRGQFPADMTSDYLHFNSLFPMSNDRVLASARTTSTLYVIDLLRGKMVDRIDSKSWKILDDPMNGFLFQHTARFRENGNLILYDNRDASEPNPRSRAVEYAVDWKARTLRLIWEYGAEDSMPFRLGWGSVQPVGEDQVLIGWGDYPRSKGYCDGKAGSFPVFTQVTRDKELVFELRAPCGWHSFRAYFVPAPAPRSP